MATRKNATETVEAPPAPEGTEVTVGSGRSRGNYKDSEPIEVKVDSTDRPYLDAITDEHREVLVKYGQLPA